MEPIDNNATEYPREYTLTSYLSAAECNAQQEMSLPMLTQRIIDVATAHANILGCGYARLIQDESAWVLSRLSIEMEEFPKINENYSLTTWVENVNRHFSERNVCIKDAQGKVLGYARTIWVAIDIHTRRPVDLTPLMVNVRPIDLPCPIAKFPRLTSVTYPYAEVSHRFRYCDIDFNRHVNTTRYVELIVNQWGLPYFDRHSIKRFDITFMLETHYDDTVTLLRKDEDGYHDIEILLAGTLCTRARISFTPRKPALQNRR